MHQSSAGIGLRPSGQLLATLEALRPLGPITFVGQSHVECLRAPLAWAGDRIRVVNLWHYSSPPERNELLALERMRELLGGIVVSVLLGAGHEIFTLFRHPRPFDFISPLEPDAPFDPGAELIPFEAVRQAISESSAHNFSLIEWVRRLNGDLLLQVEPPPVWRDEGDAAEWKSGIDDPDRPFGSRYLRRKAHIVHLQLLWSFCVERGIELVSPPPETIDDEGFLRPAYSKDAWHGNEAYGYLMAERILRRIATLKGIEPVPAG
jgi:hypothetical protein